MSKLRLDIDTEEVVKYLFEIADGNITQTSRMFGCSTKLVRNARDGKREWVKEVKDAYRKRRPTLDWSLPLCTCCNKRPRDKNNRYLCMVCYQENTDEKSPGENIPTRASLSKTSF